MDEENEDQRILLIFHILDLRLEYKSFQLHYHILFTLKLSRDDKDDIHDVVDGCEVKFVTHVWQMKCLTPREDPSLAQHGPGRDGHECRLQAASLVLLFTRATEHLVPRVLGASSG